MTRFVHWLDPKLERFRGPKKKPQPYTPKNEKELVGVLQRTPETVLSAVQRVAIASAMSYQNIPVSKIMEKAEHVVSLHEDDILGALTLDRLFKTGLTIFPVFDQSEQICGILRVEQIDALKVVRADYSLDMLLATFLRTNNNFCIVIDRDGEIVGYVTLGMFILQFFGEGVYDNFELDADKTAVARRSQK